jgi:hypothetical protein
MEVFTSAILLSYKVSSLELYYPFKEQNSSEQYLKKKKKKKKPRGS